MQWLLWHHTPPSGLKQNTLPAQKAPLLSQFWLPEIKVRTAANDYM